MGEQLATEICSVAVLILLIAFFLSSFGYLSSQSRIYFLINAIGGITAAICSYFLGVIPFVILEGTWGFFALLKLVYQPSNTKTAKY